MTNNQLSLWFNVTGACLALWGLLFADDGILSHLVSAAFLIWFMRDALRAANRIVTGRTR